MASSDDRIPAGAVVRSVAPMPRPRGSTCIHGGLDEDTPKRRELTDPPTAPVAAADKPASNTPGEPFKGEVSRTDSPGAGVSAARETNPPRKAVSSDTRSSPDKPEINKSPGDH